MKRLVFLLFALSLCSSTSHAAATSVDVYGTVKTNIDSVIGNTRFPAFPLWHNNFNDRNGIADGILTFGTLLIGTREECTFSPPDVNGNTITEFALKLKLVTSDGLQVGTIRHTYTSEPVPLGIPQTPCVIANTPVWGNLGIAAANNVPYVVIGSVYNNLINVQTDAGPVVRDNASYTIAVYNLDGTLKWSKRLVGLRGDYEFDPIFTVSPYQGMNGLLHKSSVGDFLNEDGNAEIKVASVKKTSDGLTYIYSYYELETGALIKKVKFFLK